ncbi:MAG: DUF3667 domain-containing protein [Phaeodactylibacter sp.]|uniref:DUF3667 domain-containing protein n=1 Tax=Phaeodactylibacter sp. TaxID=1940289 RepID=UPI0032ED32A2
MPQDAPERITLRYLINELLLIANLEKGFGYTVKRLLLRPGQAVEEFLEVDRKRMMKPFPMLVLLVTIATFLSLRLLPLGEPLWQDFSEDGGANLLPPFLWEAFHLLTIGMQKYFNLLFVLSLPGQAVGSYLLFRKSRYNFAEHLVINTYLFSIQTLIYTLILPFLIWNDKVAGPILIAGMFGYWLYALRQIFQPGWWPLLWKSAAIALIGQAVTNFLILAAFFGYWVYQSIFS